METSISRAKNNIFIHNFNFPSPLTFQKTNIFIQDEEEKKYKNCGSCSYPPTQFNYFLGICFTKLLLRLKRSLQHIFLVIFMWSSNLQLTWKNGSTKISNPWNSENRVFICHEFGIGTFGTCRCSPHHKFQTVMNFKKLFHS